LIVVMVMVVVMIKMMTVVSRHSGFLPRWVKPRIDQA